MPIADGPDPAPDSRISGKLLLAVLAVLSAAFVVLTMLLARL